MSYQIFISYRRDGGDALGQLFYDRLSKLGYSVFLDVEALRSGPFNTELYSVISDCEDFLLVLPPHGLDRCISEDDWVRKEIEYALKMRKNIIPVMMRGFEFPDNLPDSMKELPMFNGITAEMTLFDGVILKLQNMLLSKPLGAKRKKFDIVDDSDLPMCMKMYYRFKTDLPKDFPVKSMILIDDIKRGKASAGKRNVIARNQADNTKIFDVFEYGQNKYAYALRENKNDSDLPEVVFYSVEDDDSLIMIEDIVRKNEILNYYGTVYRLLSVMPECLKPSFLKYYKCVLVSMMSDFERSKFDFEIQRKESSDADMNLTKAYRAIELLCSYNNLMTPNVLGYSKKTMLRSKRPVCITCLNNKNPVLYIVDEKYGKISEIIEGKGLLTENIDLMHPERSKKSRFLQYFKTCNVHSPMDGYTIIDLARVDALQDAQSELNIKIQTDIFVAFAYPQYKNEPDNLLREPAFFEITRDKDLSLSIEKLSDKDLGFYLDDMGLRERFSLSAAMLDSYFPDVFNNSVRIVEG